MAFIKRLTPGDRLQVTYLPYQGQRFLTTIKGLKIKSVETPFFVLRKTGRKIIGRVEFVYALVSKGVEQAEVLVPNVKDKNGTLAPDPKILAQLTALQPNSPVELEVRRQGRVVFIKSIGPYVQPITAKFVRTAVGTSGDRKYFCVVVDAEGQEILIGLENTDKDPKKDPSPDKKLREAVTKLRPAQMVIMKLVSKNNRLFLQKIEPLPLPKKPKRR